MPRRQHVVRLTTVERAELKHLIRAGEAAAQVLSRGRILLKADAEGSGPYMSDFQIAEAVEVSTRTVARTRAAFTDRGVAGTLQALPRKREYVRRLDGDGEIKLIKLACGPAPAGRGRWTLRLLSETLVELDIVESIAPNTVRSTLKKTPSNRIVCANGACPPLTPPS